MSRWFRHYAGMMRDEKLVRAAMAAKQPVERVVWVWGAILESAAEINDGGKFQLDPAETAYFLRTDEADIRAILDALAALHRLAGDIVVKWGTRQFQSDRSASRQAAHRERKQERHSNDQQTSRDGEVTAEDRHRDVTVTHHRQSTDTENIEQKERKKDIRAVASATRPDVESDFKKFWEAYPKRGSAANPRKPAFERFEKLLRSGHDPTQITAGARRYRDLERAAGRENTDKIAQAITWLNQERWRDYLEAPSARSDTEPIWKKPPPEYLEAMAKKQQAIHGEAVGAEVRSGPGMVQNGADHTGKLPVSSGMALRPEVGPAGRPAPDSS